MTYQQTLWIAIIDKGALALLILLAGFGLNWYLEKRKARAGLQEALAKERAKSYSSLWTLMDELGLNNAVEPDDNEPFSAKDAQGCRRRLDEWYFTEHGAMYLSYRATKLLFAAQRDLTQGLHNGRPLPRKAVKGAFSKVRTQMKRDCGIYSFLEAERSVVPKAVRKPT